MLAALSFHRIQGSRFQNRGESRPLCRCSDKASGPPVSSLRCGSLSAGGGSEVPVGGAGGALWPCAGTPGGLLGPLLQVGIGWIDDDQGVSSAVGAVVPVVLISEAVNCSADGVDQLDSLAVVG
jgi:hypothetical protein